MHEPVVLILWYARTFLVEHKKLPGHGQNLLSLSLIYCCDLIIAEIKQLLSEIKLIKMLSGTQACNN